MNQIYYQNEAYSHYFKSNEILRNEVVNLINKRIFSITEITSLAIDPASENLDNVKLDPTNYKKVNIEENFKNFHLTVKFLHWDDHPAFMILVDDLTLKQSLENLKRVDEYKDKVIASISHELRTPLNGIIGMIESAFDLNPTSELKQYLKNCESCAKLLLHFVNSILDLNQIKAEKARIDWNWVPIKEVVQELKSIYSFMAARKKVQFEIDIDSNVPATIYSDRLKICQVLINLITNALKFTKENGTVKLSVSYEENEGKFLFSVKDSGVGIKPEDLKKLFTAFGRLENEDKKINSCGVGLGLYISNEIVKLLNGNPKNIICVESTLGEGSKFFFSLSSQVDPPENNDQANVSRDSLTEGSFCCSNVELVESSKVVPKSGYSKFRNYGSTSPSNSISHYDPSDTHVDKVLTKTCLVIDDNTFNLLAITRQLKKLGIATSTCMSGEDGISLLMKNTYDLVFMDIQMPIMDGIETTKLIIEKFNQNLIPEIPIIALTANGEVNKKSYLEAGMSDILVKPVALDDLKNILSKWMK